MKEVTEIDKKYFRYVSQAIGVNSEVFAYYDENETHSIDILSCDDPTDSEVKFYSTIGLSGYPNPINIKDGSVANIPVELLMAGYKEYEQIPNILSTASFFIIKNKWNCQPGTVFETIVSDYYRCDMKHIMFTPPFLWEDKLSRVEIDNRKIYPLLLVPISDKELEYKSKYGTDALETLFENEAIDIFDIKRKSTV
ncbi:suppressor of fused domain protein [Treponema pedis]|uniref:suppressor of fused domain protein n=1 Tax=Treponema pedis TaxID=409322 RepID=UPI0004226B18|nr:suppressor of fused domain protein [Treponema pedis]